MFNYVHPYPCGFYGDSQKPCTCAAPVVTKYQRRLSGPLLDRIDIQIEVPRVDYEKLSGDRLAKSSEINDGINSNASVADAVMEYPRRY